MANKIRDDLDRTTVSEYARSHGLEVIGEIPFDDDLRRAEQRRIAPLETTARTLGDIGQLATALLS